MAYLTVPISIFKHLQKPFIFLVLFFSAPTCHAGSLYDFFVGGAIKNLAKLYVRTSNLPKLKAKYIKQITKMKEDKFRKHYMLFYDVYQELPPDLRQKFVFTDATTKTEVIQKIDTLKKKDLIIIINKIPSDFILRKTRYYSNKQRDPAPNAPEKNEMQIWKNIIHKA